MQLVLDLVITVVSVVVIASYSWSLRGHFASSKMPAGAKVISAGVTATSVYFLYLVWSEDQSAAAQVAGLFIQLAGAALFWSAVSASRKARLRFAFDPENPHSIVTGGPYRYLRHPFYTSYLLFWSGWAIAAWSAWTILPVAIFAAIYVTAALAEEKKFSGSPLAGDYEAYKTRAGFFWPRLGR
ncbi:isoprenylcysteine carboxylmethyltransferase family protein [Mesorhizobium sp. WSM2239]|uniref:Isoprenylcysteine carboxylmethyltransferase family protein n=2 Tax=unclassified Mesorhizobium TaxID=325217 RepID=A0AAU8DC82_9HYPH